MSISKKRAPIVSDPQLNNVIRKLYDDLNELINSVNQKLTVDDTNGFKGSLGDIRVVQTSGKEYEIQGKTKDGWASASLTFKDE
tara:strand:+ start:363 stop:614 length:252 start_codon:yes stop_codon:yes gene_type:complete